MLISPKNRKLRDEYDKLEGALRKLGVDSENVDQNVVGHNVGHNVGLNNADDYEDEENLFDDDDYSDFEEDVHEVKTALKILQNNVWNSI